MKYTLISGRLVPCGLILNELISNSYKRAFENKEGGEIKIVCTKIDKKNTIMGSDNGVGFDMKNKLVTPKSLGLTLITALDQFSGNMKQGSIMERPSLFLLKFEIISK